MQVHIPDIIFLVEIESISDNKREDAHACLHSYLQSQGWQCGQYAIRINVELLYQDMVCYHEEYCETLQNGRLVFCNQNLFHRLLFELSLIHYHIMCT